MTNMKRFSNQILMGLANVLFLLGCTQQFQSSIPVMPTISPSQSPAPANTFTVTPAAARTPTPTVTQQPAATDTSIYSVDPNSLYLSNMLSYDTPRNITGGLKMDSEYWQSEIWIDGKYYAKGLGMHAPPGGIGSVIYKVPSGYAMFVSLAGLAREDGNPGCETAGDARFRVYVNDELEFGSEIVRFGAPLVVQVSVQEGDILKLEVDSGEDGYECDHSTWADARFEP